jgi:hypothetical protein
MILLLRIRAHQHCAGGCGEADIHCEQKTGLCLYCYALMLKVQSSPRQKLLAKVRKQLQAFTHN